MEEKERESSPKKVLRPTSAFPPYNDGLPFIKSICADDLHQLVDDHLEVDGGFRLKEDPTGKPKLYATINECVRVSVDMLAASLKSFIQRYGMVKEQCDIITELLTKAAVANVLFPFFINNSFIYAYIKKQDDSYEEFIINSDLYFLLDDQFLIDVSNYLREFCFNLY